MGASLTRLATSDRRPIARVKRRSADEVRGLRKSLHKDVEAGGLPISDAVRKMREALGLSQERFGKVFRLTTRQVWEIEAGLYNPTLATMSKLGKPFGFQVGFVL